MTKNAHESLFTAFDNVLLALNFMLSQFGTGKKTFADYPVMAPMDNSGWAKLDKYSRLRRTACLCRGYCATPSHKWHYVHENW